MGGILSIGAMKRWVLKEIPSGLTPHPIPVIDDILALFHEAGNIRAMSFPG